MAYTGVMADVGCDLIEDTIIIHESGNADFIERAPYFHYKKPYIFLRDVDVEPVILDGEEYFEG
jgi:carbamoyl-phosphate synthase large subunit